MEACKKYLRNQCQWEMCKLEHSSAQDFCVSCWQRNRSRLPLLILRVILFALSVAIMAGSMSMWITSYNAGFGLWFIYMTHWGVVLLVFTTGFSAAISAINYFKRPMDGTFGLPWYVKTYWVLYNVSVPIAFLITLFYWTILHSTSALEAIEYAPNPLLDISVHAINSVIMLLELSVAGHPSRLMHFYQPLGFGVIYLIFGLIFYFAGGRDPWGNRYVYPVIDWAYPGWTTLVVLGTALFLILLHLFVIGIVAGRNALATKYRQRGDSDVRDKNEDTHLRSENALENIAL